MKEKVRHIKWTRWRSFLNTEELPEGERTCHPSICHSDDRTIQTAQKPPHTNTQTPRNYAHSTPRQFLSPTYTQKWDSSSPQDTDRRPPITIRVTFGSEDQIDWQANRCAQYSEPSQKDSVVTIHSEMFQTPVHPGALISPVSGMFSGWTGADIICFTL
jgi:hypothetical protein